MPLLLVALTSLSSGCANLIARTGTDLTPLKTKDEIHAKLGEPFATMKNVEVYHTRRKIAEPYTMRCYGPGYAMGLVLTCGAIDLYCVPRELCLIGQRTLVGQTIEVAYDGDTVTDVTLDGESLYFLGTLRHRQDTSEQATQPGEPTADTRLATVPQ